MANKNRMYMIGILGLTASLLAACGGQGGGQNAQAPASPAIASDNSEASAIYKKQCLSCHGADLGGKVGPNLQKAGAKLSQEQLADKIRSGGGGMPAFKSTLSEQEIESLSSWLAAKK
ncbi:c-type cytochrome [Paenibacillus hamazuiensis]|uniref:c-type cytochrome n=1 Tax=Paenibacillus hamazuiensis TaxID=2936508 RepID=UPI0020104CB3|nr:cytochrome c [Paenibacillus hamazuiensis]